MTLYCVHKPHPFTLRQVFYHSENKPPEVVPGVIRCDRCLTSWYDDAPEPKVAIGILEDK